MIVKKITTGFVVQTFDTVTGRCLSQEFVAGDQVEFEDQGGNILDVVGDDLDDLYEPFEMQKPED